jgi:hypothetical protein
MCIEEINNNNDSTKKKMNLLVIEVQTKRHIILMDHRQNDAQEREQLQNIITTQTKLKKKRPTFANRLNK